jgi:hypothetical protein
MPDDNQNGELEPAAESPESAPGSEPEYPVDRLRQRFSQSFGNRPIMVYLVLVAGAATLVLLLAIVWISATGGGSDERPICTAISTDEAEQVILGGQVERIKVLVDRDEPLQTLTGIVLELSDGTCRQPAQGADARNDLYRLLGVVEHYNNFGDQRIRVHYQRQEIQPELLSTSTPTETPTAPVTETPTVESTATATATIETPSTPTTTPTETTLVTTAGTAESASPEPLVSSPTPTP